VDKWPSSGRRKVQFFVSFASAMSRHFKPNNSLCRYQQKREEAIQSARRQYLYNKLSNEQREAIDDQLDSSTYSFDDGLEEFVVNKECEVAADIRALHREGIHPALILGAFEAGNCTVEFPTGGFTTDKKRLLDVPLREDEFRSVDSDIDFEEDEVEAIDYEDFYIPPAMAEKGGALTSVFSLLAPTPSTSCCWNACHQLGSFTPTRGTCPTASEKAFSAACTDSLSFVPTTKVGQRLELLASQELRGNAGSGSEARKLCEHYGLPLRSGRDCITSHFQQGVETGPVKAVRDLRSFDRFPGGRVRYYPCRPRSCPSEPSRRRIQNRRSEFCKLF